jgi:hypothetical protein
MVEDAANSKQLSLVTGAGKGSAGLLRNCWRGAEQKCWQRAARLNRLPFRACGCSAGRRVILMLDRQPEPLAPQ